MTINLIHPSNYFEPKKLLDPNMFLDSKIFYPKKSFFIHQIQTLIRSNSNVSRYIPRGGTVGNTPIAKKFKILDNNSGYQN